MKKRNKMYVMIGLAVTILVLVGTSYAWWTTTAMQHGINEITSSCLKLSLTEEQNDIYLEKAYPITDEEAKSLTPYSFTLQNVCDTNVNYIVKLEKLKTNTEDKSTILDSKYVAVEVNDGQKEILGNYPDGKSTYEGKEYESIETKNIAAGTLKGSGQKEFKIKLWMDEDVTIEDQAMDKSLRSKIVVDGSINEYAIYTEPKLKGTDPVLESKVSTISTEENGKLIPVVIGEDGKVTKAKLSEEWYNYEEKRWANAVILTEGTKEPEEGEPISENDIESYFVWIPKYSYKLFDKELGNYDGVLPDGSELPNKGETTAIEIRFGINDTTNENKNECESPKKPGETGDCAYGEWMTHPAFLAFEGTTGLWVGKFETGYEGANSTSEAENHNNATEADKIVIKPNVYSWRNIKIGNAFNVSKNYEPDLQSHMLKNTEWGAVAYLTNSLYGRCNNEYGTIKCEEVTINNNSNFVTGYAGAENSSSSVVALPENNANGTYNYKDSYSTKASTTGNYSGIYDMSGGAWEGLAGVVTNATTAENVGLDNIQFGASGLTGEEIPSLKYIDLYLTVASLQWGKGILGDAIGELGPFKKGLDNYTASSWYQDWAGYTYVASSWINRGNLFSDGGLKGGLFGFGPYDGGNKHYVTFRIVLAL